ncbi:hypothetical protein [Dactylosporangium darangshiense]|uniref:hypothetical protein n=1 Tax=Dactylosporangium darangshiense TaxID=579108 RepID=UPI003625B2A0
MRVYEREDYDEAVRLLSRNVVPAGRLVSRVVPLDDVDAAFRALEAGGDLKVLLDCGGTS